MSLWIAENRYAGASFVVSPKTRTVTEYAPILKRVERSLQGMCGAEVAVNLLRRSEFKVYASH
jgi:hypothetical protein